MKAAKNFFLKKLHCSTARCSGLKNKCIVGFQVILQIEGDLPRICLPFSIKEEKKVMIFKSEIEDIPFSPLSKKASRGSEALKPRPR